MPLPTPLSTVPLLLVVMVPKPLLLTLGKPLTSSESTASTAATGASIFAIGASTLASAHDVSIYYATFAPAALDAVAFAASVFPRTA